MNTLKPIAILSANNNHSFELGCVCELFVMQQSEYPDWYQSITVSPDTIGTMCADGTPAQQQYPSQMLIITDDKWLGLPDSPLLYAKLRHFHQNGGRLVAFGRGIAVLAAADLLDGKKVPGGCLSQVQQKNHPQIDFCLGERFSCDPGLYCAGTGFACLELGLYLVAKDLGESTMQVIAKKLQLPDDLTASIISKLQRRCNVISPRIKTVLEWAEAHLGDIDSVDQLASRACLSRRSFDRQFRTALDVSPKDWLTEKRLIRAKQYLSSSELSIEEIAGITGFGSGNNFRNNFQKITGHSPTAYRRELSLN